jgi:hypothetical protein
VDGPRDLLLAGRVDGNISEVCEHFGFGRHLFSFALENDGGNELQVCSRSVTDATSTTVCNYVFQLMTWSNTIWTHLTITALPSVSTDTLSRFLENSRSSGGTISFEADCLSKLSHDQLRRYLRVFEDSTGPHHRIELNVGENWSQLRTEDAVTLADFLQRCQCTIILRVFYNQTLPSLILDVLRGDSNIVELQLRHVLTNIDGLVRVLAENKTLVRLTFWDTRISDENWTVLCHSLSRHPKLEFLRLFRTFPYRPDHHSNERKTRRTHFFLKMLQANIVLQDLDTPRWLLNSRFDEFDERILSDVIQPYLRRLAHVRAFGNNRGPGYKQLLASALHKVDDSPALVWTLIRSSIPTILESEEDN